MKMFLALLLILAGAPCFAAVGYINGAGAYTTTATCNGPGTFTPAAGNDLVAVVETFTAGATFSSVSSSIGATITTDLPFFVDSTNNIGYGVFRVHNATNVAQGITVTFTAGVGCFETYLQLSSVGSFDQVTAVASGVSSSFLTNSLTPAQNGALLIAVGGITTGSGITFSSWTNSFTDTGHDRSSGPQAYSATLPQTTKASVNAGATLSSGTHGWSGILLDYIPSTGPTAAQAASFFLSQ